MGAPEQLLGDGKRYRGLLDAQTMDSSTSQALVAQDGAEDGKRRGKGEAPMHTLTPQVTGGGAAQLQGPHLVPALPTAPG